MNYKHTDNIEHMYTWMKENGYTKTEIFNAKKAAKFEGLVGIRPTFLDGCLTTTKRMNTGNQTGTSGDIHMMITSSQNC